MCAAQLPGRAARSVLTRAELLRVDVAARREQALGLSAPNWGPEKTGAKADVVSLYEDSTRRPERTRAPGRRVGCRPVPTGVAATTSRVTATERARPPCPRAGRTEKAASRRVACLGIVAALLGRLAVTGGREAHAVSSRAALTARARAAAPALPGPFHGYLLIADRGNNRMLLVDGAKRRVWGYPKRTPGMPFRFDDDTFFGPTPNRIISNQEDQHTIQVIAFPSGRILWRYGHTNVRGGAPGYLNTPDDAYLLRNGLVSVADAYNCRVLFIARSHRVVRQYGTTGICRHDPPSFLGAVNGATPLPDGGTLVSEITGSWIDDIGPGGRLRWAVQAPVSYPSDPQPLSHGRILLADYARPGHVIIMDRHGHVLWRYGPASGPGELDHPSLAASFTPGLIAVNDDYRHRVVFISVRTHRIVWQYGHTDVARTGARIPEHPRRHGVPLGARDRRQSDAPPARRVGHLPVAGRRSVTPRGAVSRAHGSCGVIQPPGPRRT